MSRWCHRPGEWRSRRLTRWGSGCLAADAVDLVGREDDKRALDVKVWVKFLPASLFAWLVVFCLFYRGSNRSRGTPLYLFKVIASSCSRAGASFATRHRSR